jgi:hypothetical protein
VLTPSTRVTSGPLAGAVTITRSAPASRCLAARSRSVNAPVDSITMAAPSCFHGSFDGSFSAVTGMRRPSTAIASAAASTRPG